MTADSAIAIATFKALEEKGWAHLTLHHVAKEAGVSLEALHKVATSREDLMAVMIAYIEAQTLGYIEENPKGEPQEDHLFDVLFARFEAAEPHKAALKRLWQDMKESPTLLRPLMPQFIEALKRLGTLGVLDFDGPLGGLQVRLFGLIYLRLLHVWLEDDSPDLAPTMAETNKAVTKYIPCLFDPSKILSLYPLS